MPPTVNIIPLHLPLEPPPPPPPPPGKNDDAKDAAKEAERRRLKEAQKKESVEAEQRIETKKKFELNFGARLKAGLSGQEKKKQFHEQVKKMKDAQFDMKQAVEEFARMNDPEAIVFFDRFDEEAEAVRAAEAAAEAARLPQEEYDDEYTLTAKERKAAAEAMKVALPSLAPAPRRTRRPSLTAASGAVPGEPAREHEQLVHALPGG
jgi:hypothetical protein